MGLYTKLAIRNVHKNIKSSCLNGLGIALSVFIIIFILSLSRGIEEQVVQRNIQFETGAVTVRFEKEICSYAESEEGNKLFDSVCSALKSNDKVKSYKPRIVLGNTLLYASEGTQRIRIKGLTELDINLLKEMVKMLEGNTEWKSVPNGIVISKALSEEHNLNVLDECNVVTQSVDGTVNMQDFIVTGIFQNTSHANKYEVYSSYDQVRTLYNTNLPTHLLVDLYDNEEAESVKATLLSELSSDNYWITTYKDTIAAAQTLSSINRNGMFGMAFFLLFISFVGICAMEVEKLNERKREIGTMLTFGFKYQNIKRMFMIESAYVTALFGLGGLILILVLIFIINQLNGVYLGNSASFAFGSSIIKPELKITDIFITLAIVAVYPLVATWLSMLSLGKQKIITLLNEK